MKNLYHQIDNTIPNQLCAQYRLCGIRKIQEAWRTLSHTVTWVHEPLHDWQTRYSQSNDAYLCLLCLECLDMIAPRLLTHTLHPSPPPESVDGLGGREGGKQMGLESQIEGERWLQWGWELAAWMPWPNHVWRTLVLLLLARPVPRNTILPPTACQNSSNAA